MLLIRNRDELKRHVQQMATMAAAEARVCRDSPTALRHAQGRSYTAEQVLTAIEAWEQFDRDDVPVGVPSRKPPRSSAEARKPTVIRPFVCDHFGVGTAGFKGLCSYCNEQATSMARIYARNGRSRMVSLCSPHAVSFDNAVFEEPATKGDPSDDS